MARKNPEVKIYAPPHFKATWRKFLEICERDGVSASHLIRVWVEGYVQSKDPGNPQRPITAWMPGHEDEKVLRYKEIVDKLVLIASRRQNEVAWWMIIAELRPYLEGAARVSEAERISRDLTRRGVKVYR